MLNYKNITAETLKLFPEYEKVLINGSGILDLDNPTAFFGLFSVYIIELINKSDKPELNPIIIRAFALFQEMEHSEDNELSELVLTSVFDHLVRDKKAQKIAFSMLGEKSHKHLEGSMIITRSKKFTN